jgi:hypothetical protein
MKKRKALVIPRSKLAHANDEQMLWIAGVLLDYLSRNGGANSSLGFCGWLTDSIRSGVFPLHVWYRRFAWLIR